MFIVIMLYMVFRLKMLFKGPTLNNIVNHLVKRQNFLYWRIIKYNEWNLCNAPFVIKMLKLGSF